MMSSSVGSSTGASSDGSTDGSVDGSAVGSVDGSAVGSSPGAAEGSSEGSDEGSDVDSLSDGGGVRSVSPLCTSDGALSFGSLEVCVCASDPDSSTELCSSMFSRA